MHGVEQYILTVPDAPATQLLLQEVSSALEELFYLPDASIAMGPDDCYIDEYFSSEWQRCLPRFFLRQPQQRQAFMQRHPDVFSPWYLVKWLYMGQHLYRIDHADIFALDNQTIAPEHQLIREIFTRLIPQEFRKDLSAFSVFDDPESEDAAVMTKRQEGAPDRVLIVNQDAFFSDDGFYPAQSLYALVHEFAHLLTLNQQQVDYYPISQMHGAAVVDLFADTCRTHLVQEWCLRQESYLEAFIDQFRSEDAFERSEYASDDVYAQELYATAPERYVTTYAATNAAEDIAESFVVFIFSSDDTGESIADQKVRFFAAYPELVTLRIHMRKRLRQLLPSE